MSTVAKSVFWTIAIFVALWSYIYYFRWDDFKRSLISETVHTLSNTDFLTQLVLDIIQGKK